MMLFVGVILGFVFHMIVSSCQTSIIGILSLAFLFLMYAILCICQSLSDISNTLLVICKYISNEYK